MKKSITTGVLTIAMTAAVLISAGVTASADTTDTTETADMNPIGTPSYNVADISHWNTVNNWSAFSSNIDTVYIKATESNTDKYTDCKLDSNAKAAQNIGLDFGFFHYFWPHSTTADAAAQADLFYSHISSYSYSCVPVLDIEVDNGMTREQIVADVKAFADEFKRLSGQDIMLYSNPSFINTYLDSSLSTYKLWISHYATKNLPNDTNVWHYWTMWQYTDEGKVDGITGSVDLSRATDGIFLNSDNPADESDDSEEPEEPNKDGYFLDVDKNYTNGSVKSINVSAALEGGQLMIVTTLSSGKQAVTYQPVENYVQTYTITVDSSAEKSTVYLIKGTFTGGDLPQIYGLAQFVTKS